MAVAAVVGCRAASDAGAGDQAARSRKPSAVASGRARDVTVLGTTATASQRDARARIDGIALPEAPHMPDQAECTRVGPDQPSLTAAHRSNACVILRGWWGVGALLVPESRAGVAGYRLLRPFSYVRTPNDSLGAPSWAALDAVLVDQGWFTETAAEATPVTTAAREQMLEEPVEIRGTILRVPTVSGAAWARLRTILDELHGPPYGSELLGIAVTLHPS
jgi:hypothetical protein